MSQVFRFVVSSQSPGGGGGGGSEGCDTVSRKIPDGSDATVTYRPKRVRSACNACKRHKIRCSGSAPCTSCQAKQTECIFLPQRHESHSQQQAYSSSAEKNDSVEESNKTLKDSRHHPVETETRRNSDSIISSRLSSPVRPLKRQLSSQLESFRPSQIRSSEGIVRQDVSSSSPIWHSNPSKASSVSPYRPSYFGFPVSGLRSDPAPIDRADDEISSTAMKQSFSLNDQNIPFSHTPRKPLKRVKHGVKLHQPYFRWLGPTSIAPPRNGTFRLLSVSLPGGQKPSKKTKLSSILVDQDSRKEMRQQQVYSVPSSTPISPSPEGDDVVDGVDGANLQTLNFDVPPRSTIDTFYQTIANYLPYLTKQEMDERLKADQVSKPLRFAIGALVGHLQSANDQLTKFYLQQAKQLIIPLLGAPSIEVVYILVLIAYAEFGQDRDSGLWSWSGLALRMSCDLGLQKDFDSISSTEVAHRRRVFWSTFCLDRFISCGTGRITTISLADVEHDPMAITWNDFGVCDAGDAPSVFGYLCKLLILMGKVSNRLNILAQKGVKQSNNNNNSNKDSSLQGDNDDDEPLETTIQYERQLRSQITKFYSALPAQLTFTVDQFQHFVKIGQSQVFLLFHFWSHALILATSYPSLAFARGPISRSDDDDDECHQRQKLFLEEQSTEMARVSALSISDMINFTELIQPEAIWCLPFASQPILMAASAVWNLWRRSSIASPACAVLSLQQSFITCQNALHKMQIKWKGVSWLTAQINSLAMAEPDVDLCKIPPSSKEVDDEEQQQQQQQEVLNNNNNTTITRIPSAEPSQQHLEMNDNTWGLVVAGTMTSYDTTAAPHLSPITTCSSISGYSPKSTSSSIMAESNSNGVMAGGGLDTPYFDQSNVAPSTTTSSSSVGAYHGIENDDQHHDDNDGDEDSKLALSQLLNSGFEDIRDDSIWKSLLSGNATLEQVFQQE